MCQPLPHLKPTSGQIQRDVLLPAVIPTCQHKHKVRNEVSRWRYSLSAGGNSVREVSLGVRSQAASWAGICLTSHPTAPWRAASDAADRHLYRSRTECTEWTERMILSRESTSCQPPRASSSSLLCNLGLPLLTTVNSLRCCRGGWGTWACEQENTLMYNTDVEDGFWKRIFNFWDGILQVSHTFLKLSNSSWRGLGSFRISTVLLWISLFLSVTIKSSRIPKNFQANEASANWEISREKSKDNEWMNEWMNDYVTEK